MAPPTAVSSSERGGQHCWPRWGSGTLSRGWSASQAKTPAESLTLLDLITPNRETIQWKKSKLCQKLHCAPLVRMQNVQIVENSPAVLQNAELPHGPAILLRGTSQENCNKHADTSTCTQVVTASFTIAKTSSDWWTSIVYPHHGERFSRGKEWHPKRRYDTRTLDNTLLSRHSYIIICYMSPLREMSRRDKSTEGKGVSSCQELWGKWGVAASGYEFFGGKWWKYSKMDYGKAYISRCCALCRLVMSDSLWPHGLQPSRLLCP